MTMKKLIIAIDGPSGSGKSTLSKMLAQRLGYINIDTGAMYRSVALLTSRRRIDPQDDRALRDLCAQLKIEFVRDNGQERVLVNGTDETTAIRSPEVSLLTAKVAASPAVRRALLEQQRELGKRGGVVLEGRDIGTVVFPAAEVKFFLCASAVERGRRRYEELRAQGVEVDLERTIREVEERDLADSRRKHAPLLKAEDAVEIDSTRMTISAVLDEMLRVVRTRE